MTDQLPILLPTLPQIRKPREGAPCNGCGLCCAMTPCVVAQEALGQSEGRCRALVFDSDRYWCDLLRGNLHLYVEELADKPWAGEVMKETMRATGAWNGRCDSLADFE